MSQKKVDKYKESKKNRKEIAKKEKNAKKLRALIGWIVLGLILAGIAVALVFTFKNCNTAEEDDGYTGTALVIQDLVDVDGTAETEAEETTAAEEDTTEAEETAEEPVDETTEEVPDDTTEAEAEDTTEAEDATEAEDTTEAESKDTARPGKT